MEPFLNFEEKSIEKAVQKASTALKINADKLEYKVISHGSSGIFGLVGVKKACIQVKVIDEVKQDDKPAKPAKPAKKKDIPSGEPIPEKLPELGREVLQKIIELITSDVDISIKTNSNRITYNLKGGNPAVLIGKRGQTLEAIQYLVEKIINRQSECRIKIKLDVEGYLEHKKERLQQMALRFAEKAALQNKPVTVGQLNSHDRRIVHLTLKDDQQVRTQSMGSGFYRKLIIFPNKENGSKTLTNQPEST